MSLYTERWVARPAWLALSIPERIAFLDQLEAGMQALTEAGAQLLGVVLREIPHVSSHYVAVWAMPDGAALGQRLEAVLEAGGWDHYFQRAAPANATTPERPKTTLPTRIAMNGRG